MKKALLSKCLLGLQAFAFWAIAWQVQGAALVLAQTRTEKPLGCIPVHERHFELSFIHSVSLTKVFDRYKIVGSTDLSIVQTQERFKAHGQGLPSLMEEPDGISFKRVNGQFILTMNREIHKLIVRTDKRFKNRLYTGNLIYNLNQWPDTGIEFSLTDQCTKSLQRLNPSRST